MNQHSNETIVARYRGTAGTNPWELPWIRSLASFHSLLTHIAIMFGATAGFALLNLVVDPDGVWSRAILVVWLVVFIAHAVGIVILRLLSDDATHSGRFPRVTSDPVQGPVSPWGAAMTGTQSTSAGGSDGDLVQSQQTDSWGNVTTANGSADLSWPEPLTVEPSSDASPPDGSEDARGRVVENNDRVPWRAATEIAWMRKRGGAEDDPDLNRKDSAT